MAEVVEARTAEELGAGEGGGAAVVGPELVLGGRTDDLATEEEEPAGTEEEDGVVAELETAAIGLEEQTELAGEEWFHGWAERRTSVDRLREDGDFLVRLSGGAAGQPAAEAVLTVLWAGVRLHLHLHKFPPTGRFHTPDGDWACLADLVRFYARPGAPPVIRAARAFLRRPVPRNNPII